MENNSPSGGKDTKVLWWMLFAIVAVLVIFGIWLLVCAVVLFRSSEKDILIGQLGTFGDSFGILSSLFSGVGILGVAFTLYKQHQDGMEAQERHNEIVRAQERIAEIQGLSSLLNTETVSLKDSIRITFYLEELHLAVSQILKPGQDPGLDFMDKVGNLIMESTNFISPMESFQILKLGASFSSPLASFSIEWHNLTSLMSSESDKVISNVLIERLRNEAETAQLRLLEEVNRLLVKYRKSMDDGLKMVDDYKSGISTTLEQIKKSRDNTP